MQLTCVLVGVLATLAALVGVNGSDDTTPLEAVVARLSADVSRLEAQLVAAQAAIAATNRRSGFMAQFSAGSVIGPPTGPFRFDHVLFNDGGNYDPSQGVYTAPYSGVYLFTIKMITGEHDSRQAVDLVVGFNVVDRFTYDNLSGQAGHGGDSRALPVVLRLSAGARVWVQPVVGYTGGTFYGLFHSTFTGSLLYAD